MENIVWHCLGSEITEQNLKKNKRARNNNNGSKYNAMVKLLISV